MAALLATTACEPGAADKADDSKPSDQPSATDSAKPGATKPAKPGASSGDNGGSSGDSGDKGTIAACAEDTLAVSAEKEPADAKGARHLLITVQNTGDKKCSVHHYPYVKLGDAQGPAPVIEDSRDPETTVTTLAPGDEAHAALLVNGPMDEYEAKSITLTLQGAENGSNASKPIDVPMPVDTLYANDFQRVTYWSTASGYVLDFIMSK